MKNSRTFKTQSESIDSLTVHTLTTENYNLLLKAQELIKLKTGLVLSVQELVNSLFDQITIQKLTDQYMKIYH